LLSKFEAYFLFGFRVSPVEGHSPFIRYYFYSFILRACLSYQQELFCVITYYV
jgi:hypothetical protein